MKYSNKRVALQCATFAAIFGLMCFFMDMMEETEEQTTYSITLENLAQGNSEADGENIWYVDPETRILYHSNGASGCSDASCNSGYGSPETKMCHIVTGGTLTTNNGESFTTSGSGSIGLSLTGVSGSLDAGASGTRTLSRSATYNWVPGTIITCPEGNNSTCNWQNCR